MVMGDVRNAIADILENTSLADVAGRMNDARDRLKNS
jgi:DNA-binding IscR family transcriptional regulator